MKLRKNRVFGVILVIVFIAGTIVFIVNKNKSSKKYGTNQFPSTEYESSIRLGVSNFDTINPILTKNKMIINLNQFIYEPLFEVKENYELCANLAKEIAKTSDTTYVLKVDNSIKWSNGTAFTVKDVKYTIELIKTRNNIFSENVKDISQLDIIDDTTLKITLNESVPFFEYKLTFPIVCQNQYSKEDFFYSAQSSIGTGRYKIESISQTQIILAKNSEYRDKSNENEKIDKIYINIYNEIGEIYNGFKIGNIDAFTTSSIKYKNYIGTLGYYAKEYYGREYDFLALNCNDNLLKDLNIRQAIECAIDKENIISNIYNNEYYCSDYPLDFGNYLYSKDYITNSYNIEKTKEILTNNGWNYSNNSWKKYGSVLSVTITVNSDNKKRVEVANNIKEQLESIGIRVNIKELAYNDYMNCINNRNYQILLTGIYNGYSPDLTYFYGEGNLANYSNEGVWSMLNEVASTTDSKVLKDKYEQIIKATDNDVAYIGLYRNRESLIISTKMKGSYIPSNYSIFNHFETWTKERN